MCIICDTRPFRIKIIIKSIQVLHQRHRQCIAHVTDDIDIGVPLTQVIWLKILSFLISTWHPGRAELFFPNALDYPIPKTRQPGH